MDPLCPVQRHLNNGKAELPPAPWDSGALSPLTLSGAQGTPISFLFRFFHYSLSFTLFKTVFLFPPQTRIPGLACPSVIGILVLIFRGLEVGAKCVLLCLEKSFFQLL